MPLSATAAASSRQAHALEQHFASRAELIVDYRTTLATLTRHLAPDDMERWSAAILDLFRANGGPRLLRALWTLQRRLAPAAEAATLVDIIGGTHVLCLSCGAGETSRLLDVVAVHLVHGDDGRTWAGLLRGLAAVADRAPEIAGGLADSLAALSQWLDIADIPAWAADAAALYPRDRRRRRAYFRLEDPIARKRVAIHAGTARFEAHKVRLSYLARALFAFDLKVQAVSADAPQSLERTRLSGGLVLVPDVSPKMSRDRQVAFYEAAILHALCHRQFTTRRFALGKMKPLQVALASLLEDARIERLAIGQFPGLAQVWSPFHVVRPSPARTAASLLARLARVLSDPQLDDPDTWVEKGRSLFEQAFAEAPADQARCERIARVLGNDIGQMRIPFDVRAYRVEPAYRDDGSGLFEFDDADRANGQALEVPLDAAMIETAPNADLAPADQSAAPTEAARSLAATQPERGPLLGVYPEWDYRIRAQDAGTAASVYRHDIPPLPAPNWLSERLADHAGESSRIGALVRRARTGRALRLKRQLEGEDLDFDAVIDTEIARRSGYAPDPRIYAIKRRLDRDVSLALLIDSSESTGAAVGEGAATILETAALAAGLLAGALAELGDPFAVYSFSSDGRDDVRLATVKDFHEPCGVTTDRLAGLRPGLSTRLGAALRHVSARLGERSSLRKVLIVVTDGEPADRDIDDPLLLIEDARRAVAQHRDAGLDIFCVALGEHADRAASGIFGRRNTLRIERISDLPSRLANLYFQLTVN